MDAATTARRYPWTAFPKTERVGPAIYERPFLVRWTLANAAPGLYGWATEQRSFPTLAEAMAVAEAPMGIAYSVEVVELVKGGKSPLPHFSRKRRA